jgi:hypothetical protein
VVGFVFSILRQLHWRSVLLALIVGICAGEIGALILIAPAEFWMTILSIGILLATIVLLRAGAD